MTKTIKILLAFTLILATLLSSVSCGGNDNEKDCTVAGLTFTIPKYMTKTASGDSECYENKSDGAKLRVYSYTLSSVTPALSSDNKAGEYAERFITQNKISVIDKKIDAGCASFSYDDEVEGNYCYDFVMTSPTLIYHMRMSCSTDLKKTYKTEFEKWAKSATLENKKINYSESGLNFSLPDYMQEMNVEYADVCYGNLNDNVQFFVYFYAKESLLTELYLDQNSTVKQYADWFVNVNGYENVEENYEEEKKKIVLKYIYEPESTFYCDTVLRNEYSLIHVTMCCDAEDRAIYESVFDEWISHLSLVY